MGEGIGAMLLPAAVMLLVICAAYYTTRYISKKAVHFNKGKYLRVVDQIMVGRDKHVVLIEAGKQVFMVGVSGQAMNSLGSIPKEQLEQLEQTDEKKDASVVSAFPDMFRRAREFVQAPAKYKQMRKQTPHGKKDDAQEDGIDRMLEAVNNRKNGAKKRNGGGDDESL